MMELSFAYLFAAVLIAGLIVMARRNRKQGWRKQRGAWFETQEQSAIRAIEVREKAPPAPLRHRADLDRLRQALVADGEPQRPEPVAVPKEDLTQSR